MNILRADMNGIRTAVRILRNGGIVAFPTETTYGIGCDPRRAKSVRRIYQIKGREKRKPLLLVAASETQAGKVVQLRASSRGLRKKHWPGPLTLILPTKNGKGETSIRVSSSRIVQRLCRAFGYPVVATSANRSGEPDCRSGKSVARAFAKAKSQPDLVLDAGALPRRKPSTVARVNEDGTIEVLRKGSIRL